jgi:hypothetical protein
MLPYQPNSDALLPPPALPALSVDPLCPLLLWDVASFFARVILSFFSDLAFAFAGLGLGFADGFGEALAISVFLGVGFAVGFGVVFAFNAAVALGFGAGVAVAVGFGVADGNSISLCAVVTTGFSSGTTSFSVCLDSVAAGGCFGGSGDSSFSDSSADTSPAPPNHTILSGFDGTLAATLQRMSPVMSATCANAIRTTFTQKRPPGVPYLCEGGPFAI